MPEIPHPPTVECLSAAVKAVSAVLKRRGLHVMTMPESDPTAFTDFADAIGRLEAAAVPIPRKARKR